MAFVPRRAPRVTYVSGLLIFFAAVLTAYSVRTPWIGAKMAASVLGATAPLQKAHASVMGELSRIVDHYRQLSQAVEVNQQLRQQLSELRAQTAKLQEFERENERLRGLLAIVDRTELLGPVARVIGMSLAGWANVVTLDVGSENGVAVGNPVVAGEGVVGRVIAVHAQSSQVLPVIDPKSSVDALLQQSRLRGVLDGSGKDGGELRFVASREAVAVGDVVVTSGFDGVFPPGLVLGRIREVGEARQELFHRISVEPAVDMARLEQVMVVTGAPPLVMEGPPVPDDVDDATEHAPLSDNGTPEKKG